MALIYRFEWPRGCTSDIRQRHVESARQPSAGGVGTATVLGHSVSHSSATILDVILQLLAMPCQLPRSRASKNTQHLRHVRRVVDRDLETYLPLSNG